MREDGRSKREDVRVIYLALRLSSCILSLKSSQVPRNLYKYYYIVYHLYIHYDAVGQSNRGIPLLLSVQ